MYIVVTKDNGMPYLIPSKFAVTFFRAFRAEMWRQGMKRDPAPKDCVLGVKIISLSV